MIECSSDTLERIRTVQDGGQVDVELVMKELSHDPHTIPGQEKVTEDLGVEKSTLWIWSNCTKSIPVYPSINVDSMLAT